VAGASQGGVGWAAPNFVSRVEEAVNYVLSDGLSAILDSHHDQWVSCMPDADQTQIGDQLSKLASRHSP